MFCDVDIAFLQTFTLFKNLKNFGLHVCTLSPFSGHLKPAGYLKEGHFWLGNAQNDHFYP
jgi:hypothetical protein